MASMISSSLSLSGVKLLSPSGGSHHPSLSASSLASNSASLCPGISRVLCSRRSYRSKSHSASIPFCVASADVPTVSDTKGAFLAKYRRPIPNIYNNVIQELIVQQHLVRYNGTYRYDPIFALGFVTVYDQLMDGFPSDEDREKIFAAYIEALGEDPAAYRRDSQTVEEWASALNPTSILEFDARDSPIDDILKDVAERSKAGKFYYSRLFAIGLFRILELASASEPSVLEKLCTSLGLKKIAVDRDLGVYRSLLNKLTQAKELLKDFLEREKKQLLEREKEKSLSSKSE